MPSGEIKRIYVFYGTNEYLKDLNARRCMQRVRCDSLNIYRFTASDDMVEVLSDMAEPSLFGEDKVLVFTNTGLFSSKAQTPDKEEKILTYFTQLCEDEHFTLIFKENDFDKRKKISKIAQLHGDIIQCDKMEQPDKLKIINSIAKAKGVQIQTAAAIFLLNNTIDDMQCVLNEMDKLSLFVGIGGEITIETIKNVCTLTVNARIFDLNDALAERKTETALSIMRSLAEEKQNISMMLVMIPRNWMMMYDAKILSLAKIDNNEIAAYLNLAPNMSFIVQKLLKQSRNFSVEELETKIDFCLELDEAVKSGRIKDVQALELMIFHNIN